jgi:hypothetical protein
VSRLPTGLAIGRAFRDELSARRLAFAPIESFDGGVEEFLGSIPCRVPEVGPRRWPGTLAGPAHRNQPTPSQTSATNASCVDQFSVV